MKSKRVVLKGSKFTVARILADNGVPFIFESEKGGNTVGSVPSAHIGKLSKLLESRPELEGRYAKNKTRKRRTAAQIAATKKLVAFNKRRRKNPRRVAIKRQLRKAGQKVKNTASTRSLRKQRAGLGNFQIFKCRGNDIRFLAMTTDGKIRWTLTRGDTVRWQTSKEAMRIARRIGRKRDYAGWQLGVAKSSMSLTHIAHHCSGKV